MATLLIKLQGNAPLNRTVFPPYLYIYDDLMIYRKRSWFVVREITMSYNQIAQATLTSGIIFATLEIYTTGAEDIIVKFIPKGLAKRAKKIIDQKLYHAHAKLHLDKDKTHTGYQDEVVEYERTVGRLKELLAKGRLTKQEYERKRQVILSKLR